VSAREGGGGGRDEKWQLFMGHVGLVEMRTNESRYDLPLRRHRPEGAVHIFLLLSPTVLAPIGGSSSGASPSAGRKKKNESRKEGRASSSTLLEERQYRKKKETR
jgi:hypothetical protein